LNKTIASNPCVRCGQERIVAKTWVDEDESMAGASKLTHTLMVCPDAECQKKLEKELDRQREARVARTKLKEDQDLARKQKLAPKIA
jgi:hypothetical protein